MECEYFKQLEDYKYGDLITQTQYWLILLAPDQRNLGTCVVALKRKESQLSGLKDYEWIDLHPIIKKMEESLRKSFPVTHFNWACLLNSAYAEKNPQPQLHWHLIPRYKKPFKWQGIIFKDPCFGKSTMHARGESLTLNPEIRDKIRATILKNLNI